MEGLGVAANVVAVVDLSAKLIGWCAQYAIDVKNANNDKARLMREITALYRVSQEAKDLLEGPRGTRLKASTTLLRAIVAGELQLQKVEQKLSSGGFDATKGPRTPVWKWPFLSKDIERTLQELSRCNQAISLALQVDQTALILDIDQRNVISLLPLAEGASFDSRAEEHNPTCLRNTRIELLKKISKWVDDRSGKAIFWLNGMAGTGKSTISRTFARSQSTIGRLGASFFFKRGEPDRSNLSKFMTTIARQLVEREPSLAPLIKEALEADPALPRSAVQKQFTKLIFEPLSRISRTVPIVIIADALDECDNNKDIRLLINIFSRAQSSQSCQLRVFVTGRPELPIRLGFNDVKNAYQDLILHEMPLPMIEHDISAFLEYELGIIRDDYDASIDEEWKLPSRWPSQSSMKALACDPDSQLKKILEYRGTSANSELDATYMPILDQQIARLSPQNREEVIRQFRHIIGTIIVLESPLSIPDLSQLLGAPQGIIKGRVDQLHSVLNVPTVLKSPVRLLHLSFRDFLVDPANRDKTPLWIDEKQMHRQMFEECLRNMSERLQSDICDIRAPGTLRTGIDHQKIEACLPPELQYCCLYWVYHLQQAEVHASDGEDVYKFLTSHLLHWLEALSLMGRAPESLDLIKTLQTMLKYDKGGELLGFLDDVMRFILANTSIISFAPLQMYSSALFFSPRKSRMRATFGSTIPRWVSIQTDLELNWGPCIQTLEGHSNSVSSVAFSHDSALLASASNDYTIRVWRPDTGECIQTLEGHSLWVYSVAFSHDSALLAPASHDYTIRIWHPDTGECIQKLEGHSGSVHSVAFSHDSALLASGS